MTDIKAGTLHIDIAGDTTDLKKSLQDAEKDLKKFDSGVSNSVQSLGEMKREFRTLSRMSMVGKSPEEIQKTTERMAFLKDAIGDTNKTIQSLSLDPFQKLAETVQVGSTFMAGFAGATSLFGGEQEKMNELMQKTIALIAVANAAQEAATFFQERSAGIWLKNKTLEIAARIKEALTINTVTVASTTENAVKSKGNIITQAITKAQWLWNAAIAANPIGLIIAGVAALGIGIAALAISMAKTKDEQNALNTAIDGTVFRSKEEVNAHNDSIFKLQELQAEILFTTGVYDEYDKKILEIERNRKKKGIEISQDELESLNKANGFWSTMLLYIQNAGNAAGVMKDKMKNIAYISDDFNKKREDNNKIADAESKLALEQQKENEKKHAEDVAEFNNKLRIALLDGKEKEIAELNDQYQKDAKNFGESALLKQKYAKDLRDIVLKYARIDDQAMIDFSKSLNADKLTKDSKIQIPTQKLDVPVSLNFLVEQFNTASINDSVQGIIVDLGDTIEQGLNNLATGMAETIGQIAAGGAGMEDLFSNLLSIVGSFMQSLGQSLIAAGIGAISFKTLLANPAAAIAAGAALVALGSAVKSKLAAGPGGGGSSYSSGGVTSRPREDLTGIRGLRAEALQVEVTGVITGKGSDLQAVLNQESKRRGL